LDKHNKIIKTPDISDIQQKQVELCELCKSSTFRYTAHEKICENCGNVLVYSKPNSDFRVTSIKRSFIPPGTQFVSIIKNGRESKVDLAKIATWLDVPQEEQKLVNTSKEILAVLEQIRFGPLDQPISETIVREIMTVWYNIINYTQTIGPELRGKQKTSLQILTIFYVLQYNNIKTINIQKITSLFSNIQLADVYSNNALISQIFANTRYDKYVTLKLGETCKIEVSSKVEKIIKIITKDLNSHGYINEVPTLSEYAGIVYYINKVLLNNKDVTLPLLHSKCSVSQNTISKFSKQIENFYIRFPQLKQKLLVFKFF
jgi:hypothetical protein